LAIARVANGDLVLAVNFVRASILEVPASKNPMSTLSMSG
jgi:hypothetical protein